MSAQTTLSGRKREITDRRKQPLENIIKCQWPVKCLLEASFSVIDFGFSPPTIWKLCEHHSNELTRMKSHVIKEILKPE